MTGLQSPPSYDGRRYLLALAAAFVTSIVAMVLLPFDDFSPQTVGRAVVVVVFFATFSLVLFGEELIGYWRRNDDASE